MRRPIRWVETNALKVLCEGPVILTKLSVDTAQVGQWYEVSRIGAFPNFIDPPRFLEVASRDIIIVCFNVELLPRANPFSQVVCFPRILGRKQVFTQIHV